MKLLLLATLALTLLAAGVLMSIGADGEDTGTAGEIRSTGPAV